MHASGWCMASDTCLPCSSCQLNFWPQHSFTQMLALLILPARPFLARRIMITILPVGHDCLPSMDYVKLIAASELCLKGHPTSICNDRAELLVRGCCGIKCHVFKDCPIVMESAAAI